MICAISAQSPALRGFFLRLLTRNLHHLPKIGIMDEV